MRAKRLCLSRAQAPSPKKTDGVSLKERRRHCFSVPREGACTCYPPALGEAKVASADATQNQEGENPMQTTHTPAPWHHFENCEGWTVTNSANEIVAFCDHSLDDKIDEPSPA